MKKTHTRYSSEEKVSIVRRHLIDGFPVSDLCDEFGIKPTVFYRWQKQLFENGSKAFEGENRRRDRTLMRKVSWLEDKLRRKDEVLSELMEEYVLLKKRFGAF